jgi:superfamily II DNA/RNA helicase
MERVLAMVPTVKQTMLFSATMPGPILTLARTFMSQPTHIRAEVATEGATHTSTKQYVYRAHALDKVEMLARVLQARGRGLTMVFTRTKRTAAKVADELTERGFAAAAVHGDLGQGAREQALRAFRSGKVDVLVATDVAARGIDVEDVTHVINFQCPEEDKTYIHRIGRTGRAGKTGIAVSFIDWDDVPRWKLINESLGLDFADPAETYSTSKHLYDDLDIPEGVTGRLPSAQRTRAGLGAEDVEDLGETGGKRRRAAAGASAGSQGGRNGGRNGSSGGGRANGGTANGGSGNGGRRSRTAHSDVSGESVAVDDQLGGINGGPTTAEHADAADGAPRRRRSRRRTRGGAPTTSEAPSTS